MKYKQIRAVYPEPVNKRVAGLRYGVAAVFVVLALAQLFAFETFSDVIAALLPASSDWLASILAAKLVILEVVAVPSLLLVKLSPAARWVSRVSGPLVMAAWYSLIFIGMTQATAPNSGLLGSKIELEANAWTLMLVVVLFGLTIAAHVFGTRRLSK